MDIDGLKLNSSNTKIKNEICKYASRFTTKKSALDAINSGKKVYILGKSAYTECSIPLNQSCEDETCHIHSRSDKRILWNDIINNENSSKLDSKCDFFDDMGRRGAPKKKKTDECICSDKESSLYIACNDPDLKSYMKMVSFILIKNKGYLKNKNDLLKIIQNNISDIDEDFDKSDNKLDFSNIHKNQNDLSNLFTTNDLLLKKTMDIVCDKNDFDNDIDNLDNDIDNLILDNTASDINSVESISCFDIKTNKGRSLWLDENTFKVYHPEDDDGGSEIGVLKEIEKKYHTINYLDKYYTVILKINHDRYNEVNCCVIENKLFDNKLKYIGTRKKLKNNKYEFKFNNEI